MNAIFADGAYHISDSEDCYILVVLFCKTVRRILSDRCLSCLSVLSVTLVYCGQTVGWINMTLGVRVGLDFCHIVLDGDPAPPPRRGTAPNFRPISVVAKWLDGSRCHLVWRWASAQAALC